MDAFTAVVTTGIYCQPGCSARPRAENTRTFLLAAAAEAAGYRACHRCRPYRYPQTLDWSAPELVCRAVGLILDGALDDGTEVELAGRLAVSARHLRRLFTGHLGVTPDGLARSARVHFARRLLDDTDLSVSEVAFAAGFGSLRQFNRACRDVFRESPRMLRARRRKADRLIADGGLLLRLPFHGPLDWKAFVGYFAARAIPGVEHVSGDTYRRTIMVDGYPGVLELLPGGPDHLLLRAHLPRWDGLVHLVQHARSIPNLDFDLEQPRRALDRDPIVGPLLRARPGLRPPGTLGRIRDRGACDHRTASQPRRREHPNRSARVASRNEGSRPRAARTDAYLSVTIHTGGDRARTVRHNAGASGGNPRLRARGGRRRGPARPQRQPQRLDLVAPRTRRGRAVDSTLHRAAARRSRRLSDERPRPTACPVITRSAHGSRGRRAGGALATMAGARRDSSLARRRAARERAPCARCRVSH
jgi:methylphosphotriester-DNA--protein-cysteine methyltransferase